MLLALAGCGGAAAPSTVGESTTSADTAGGDYAGEEEAGAAEGGEMMVGPLGPEQQDTVDGYDDEVTQLTSDLDGAMELASPDCGRAGELRDAICDLADRICSIADDNPEHEDVAGQCEDGQSRCESARDRVDQRCP
jgi:hypothetical protein